MSSPQEPSRRQKTREKLRTWLNAGLGKWLLRTRLRSAYGFLIFFALFLAYAVVVLAYAVVAGTTERSLGWHLVVNAFLAAASVFLCFLVPKKQVKPDEQEDNSGKRTPGADASAEHGAAARRRVGLTLWSLAHAVAFLAALWCAMGAYYLLRSLAAEIWPLQALIWVSVAAAGAGVYVLFLREFQSEENRIGDFGPSYLGHALILLAALALAAWTYSFLVGWCYRNLAQAYARANVFADVLTTDPTLAWQPGADGWLVKPAPKVGQAMSEQEFRRLQLFRILQLTNRVGPDDTLQQSPRKKAFDPLIDHLCRDDKVAEQFFRRKASTLDLVAFIAQMKGWQVPAGIEDPFRPFLVKATAAAFAQQPGFDERYRAIARTHAEQGARRAMEESLAGYGENFGASLTFSTSGALKEEEILNLLYEITGVTSKHSSLREIDTKQKQERESFLFTNDFVSDLFSRIRGNPDVRAAQFYLSIILGYEQFGELLAFWWLLLLMGCRLVRFYLESRAKNRFLKALHIEKEEQNPTTLEKRCAVIRKALEKVQEAAAPNLGQAYPSAWAEHQAKNPMAHILGNSVKKELFEKQLEKQNWEKAKAKDGQKTGTGPTPTSPDVLKDQCEEARDNSSATRWLIRYLATALPALGFIGTVRGMLLALSNADSIVLAQTTAAQASAVTSVAGQLGICFTTTFLALILGLIAKYLNDKQIHAEGQLIGDLERELKPMVQPSAEQEAQP